MNLKNLVIRISIIEFSIYYLNFQLLNWIFNFELIQRILGFIIIKNINLKSFICEA